MRYVPGPDDCLLLYSFDAAGRPEVARWNAVIAIVCATGANPAEISELKAKDLVMNDYGVTTFAFSGKRKRVVPVHSRAVPLLKSYLAVCPPGTQTRLFDWNGRQLLRGQLRAELVDRSRQLGFPAMVSARGLRLACIRDLLASGMPAEAIAQLIGAKRLDVMLESVRGL
jgi:site-specific recombinase XerD